MAIKIKIVADYDQRGMSKATKALDNFGKQAQIALGAVAVATAALAVKSVQEFAKFEGALNQSLAIMGNVSDTMKGEMADAAREMAKTTTFSAEQAAESYFFLASAGLSAEASVKALPRVASFAQAGMFEMARATDLLTDAQSALGLTIRDDAVANMENMARVSDVLVKANTLANASVEQFSVALTTKAGASLRALGKDVEEGVAVLAAFADQGIKGELAGTQLGIVLRDLTTKAIDNKAAFDEAGIAVFDANGEMNNLADIVGDLEGALVGMSDETQKATLLQLGFSDKSLASLQALLGTSDAIRTYEESLRSASGVTDEIAEKQLESFNSQLALLQSAVTDVFIEIGEQLTPALKDLVERVKELLPEIGDKLVTAISKVDFAKIVEDFGNFVVLIVENLETIGKVAGGLLGVAAALATYRIAAQLAATATALLNSTLVLSPFGIAITLLAGATFAVLKLKEANDKAKEGVAELSDEERKRQRELKKLRRDEADLLRQIEASTGYMKTNYETQLKRVRMELIKVGYAAEDSAGEINRFNNLKLDALIRQANRARAAFSGITFTGSGGTADWLNQMFGTGPSAAGADLGGGGTGGAGGSGPSAFEIARERVRELIKDSQKQLADAQETYNDTVLRANENYLANVAQLEQTFTDKLAGIVQQSKDRLRSAFADAVTRGMSLSTIFFGEDAEGEVTSGVSNLIENMRERLRKSNMLIQQTSDLAALGFTQPFIEEIVSAGVDTGNELASAILDSEPVIQKELRNLYQELEQQSSHGMDALADTIYEKQGLATQQLKDLYATTEMELADALIAQQELLQETLLEANEVFRDSVAEIKEALVENLEELDGEFGGLTKTINQFMGKLDELVRKHAEAAKELSKPLGNGGGTSTSVTGSEVPDVIADAVDEELTNLNAAIASIEKIYNDLKAADPGFVESPEFYADLAEMKARRDELAGSNNTTINVNVKVDPTQSPAMVGASVANTLQTYFTTGGGIKYVTV